MPMDAGDVLPDEISEILGRLRRRRSDAVAPAARRARCRMGPRLDAPVRELRRPPLCGGLDRSSPPARTKDGCELTLKTQSPGILARQRQTTLDKCDIGMASLRQAQCFDFGAGDLAAAFATSVSGWGLPGMWHMFRRPRRCWSSVMSREPIFALPVCALVLPVAGISCNGPCCGADWPDRSFAAPAKLQGVASRVLV